MREVVTGRHQRGLPMLVLLTVVVVTLAFAAPALASSSPSPAAADAGAPAVGPSPLVPELTAALDRTSVVFGDQVTVSGVVTPAASGQQLTVKHGDTVAGTAVTDADGVYSLNFTPRRSGDVVVGLDASPGVVAPAVALAVKPQVTVTHGALVPFISATVTVKVVPAAYDGLVVVKVTHKKAVVGSWKARAAGGKATLHIPFRGVDGFTLDVTAPAAAGLDARTVQARFNVRPKTLSAGAKGPYVKGMLTALSGLRFRIPGMGSTFTSKVKDSVMAFQKAYGLSRTYVFNTACWRKIDGARLIKARHASPGTHLEVDKGRQIAMVVKGGKPYGIICVSTGATGNTPEGTFHIQQKHSYTTSGFGGILVRTMGFVGNFAMHGYTPVPPYPASHGCVREPIWACYWMYDQSWVGETLYIYH